MVAALIVIPSAVLFGTSRSVAWHSAQYFEISRFLGPHCKRSILSFFQVEVRKWIDLKQKQTIEVPSHDTYNISRYLVQAREDVGRKRIRCTWASSNKHLMTVPRGKSGFCLPETLNVSRGTCQELFCYTPQLKMNKTKYEYNPYKFNNYKSNMSNTND